MLSCFLLVLVILLEVPYVILGRGRTTYKHAMSSWQSIHKDRQIHEMKIVVLFPDLL